MENKLLNLMDQLLLKIMAFFVLVKTETLRLLELIKPYFAPYEKEFIWIIPIAVILFIFLFFALKRNARKKDKKNDAAIKDEEPFVETAISEIETRPEAKTELVGQTEPEKISDIRQKTEKPAGILKNIRTGLAKTRKAFSASVDKIFTGGLNENMLEELEELLITSDVGVKTSMEIIETISDKSSEIKSPDDLKRILKEEICKYINVEDKTEKDFSAKPHVIMVVGVNGVGKTTTIGKLASKFIKEGKKVLIVAADTFRAAASDQLKVWADRSGAGLVRHKDNSDPSAVAYDGMEAAIARGVDIVIIDTAGRLHTKKNLMEELKKIERTIAKKMSDAPHETLMVVDATTGQNALQQAQFFNEAVGITTIALTKLDGTAKGGIVIGITNTLNIPLKYIGVGEQIDDLQEFNSKEFVDALI